MDASPGLARNFGQDSVRIEWLGIGSMGNRVLPNTGLEFVMDFVVLQAIDNDLDVYGPIKLVVQDHVDFATDLATQLGGICMVICAPLHHLVPRRLSSRGF